VLCHFARCLLKQWWQAARARQGAALRPIITLSLNAPYNVPSKASTAAVARLHAPHKRDINIQKEPGIIFTLFTVSQKSSSKSVRHSDDNCDNRFDNFDKIQELRNV